MACPRLPLLRHPQYRPRREVSDWLRSSSVEPTALAPALCTTTDAYLISRRYSRFRTRLPSGGGRHAPRYNADGGTRVPSLSLTGLDSYIYFPLSCRRSKATIAYPLRAGVWRPVSDALIDGDISYECRRDFSSFVRGFPTAHLTFTIYQGDTEGATLNAPYPEGAA